jgi:hypothetical protein
MMKTASLFAAILALGLSGTAIAECAYPKAPAAIPNGKTAAEAEMVDAMKQFKQYDTDVTAYITCLQQEVKQKQEDGASISTVMQLKSLQSKKQNTALEEQQAKTAKFNEQIRAFKSRKG